MSPSTSVQWHNVTDPPYSAAPSPIQAAIDAAAASPTGGVVYVPAGIYTIPSPLIVPANQTPPPGASIRAVTLLGDGPDATLITQPASADILQILGSQTTISGLTLQGPHPTTSPTAGCGIVVGSPSQSHTIDKLYLQRVDVRQTYSYGLHVLEGTAQRFTAIFCSYTDCRFSLNLHDAAVYIQRYNSAHYFKGCNIEGFSDHGIRLDRCEGVSFIDGAIEGPPATGSTQPYLYANGAVDVVLQNMWFEDQPLASAVQWFVFLENGCAGWSCIGCTFRRVVGLDPKAFAIGNVQSAPCRSIVLVSPRMVVGHTGAVGSNQVVVGNPESEAIVIGGTVSQPGTTSPVRVLDGTHRTMLLGSRNRIRAARMTTLERDAIPAAERMAGDLIFNTTSLRGEMWDGGQWRGLW